MREGEGKNWGGCAIPPDPRRDFRTGWGGGRE